MPIITTHTLPPPIQQSFNRYLLDWLYGLLKEVEDSLVPYANRKIRVQDKGKRKEFDKLLQQFKVVYERKKIEEKIYKEKVKNSPKMPRFPIARETCRFKRVLN